MNNHTARTQGIHHAGLTVPDLGVARTFFEEALGFTAVGEVPEHLGAGPTRHMMCTIPGRIRLELIAPVAI
jgi:catechol 2,3-dioxygenase-like lactoylglutathione lyase family enzyme